MAKGMDISSLGNLHEMLSGAPLAIAGSTPRGHISIEHEILDHVGSRPMVAAK